MAGGRDRTQDDGPETFPEYLQWLKSTGSALLITGETPLIARAQASRRFFGQVADSAATRRGRILVQTTPDSKPALFLPEEVSSQDDDVRVVTFCEASRNAAATTTCSPTGNLGPQPDDDFDAVVEAVAAAVDDLIEGAPSRPDPIRVGMTTLRPLIECSSSATVHSLIERVAAAVTGPGGMAHFHLPFPDDDRLVERLTEAVDARVELRTREQYIVESRWHVPALDTSEQPGWIRL